MCPQVGPASRENQELNPIYAFDRHLLSTPYIPVTGAVQIRPALPPKSQEDKVSTHAHS